MLSKGKILIYGHDEILLTTRKRVLESAGYEVMTASTITEYESLGSGFDPEELVSLVCYTVPKDEVMKIRQNAEKSRSSVYFLDGLLIPTELIHKVSQLAHLPTQTQ